MTDEQQFDDPPDNFNILDYVKFSSNNSRSAATNKLVPN